jgi:hypothetical protein
MWKIGERVGVKSAANLSLIATKIANGHAYAEHIHEFKHLGILTLSDFEKHINLVLKSPTDSFLGKNGKKYFWYDPTKTFVVIDDAHVDMGSAFIPSRGKLYYDDQLLK